MAPTEYEDETFEPPPCKPRPAGPGRLMLWSVMVLVLEVGVLAYVLLPSGT